MAVTQFHLVSEWHFDAPLQRVWEEIFRSDDWPKWWRAVKRVELLSAGDASGLGSVRIFTWGTALPYQNRLRITATRVEPMRFLEGRAEGDLDGTGLWTFTPQGNGTHLRYDWKIELTKPWQRVLAPLMRPVFAWNHRVVMGWGYEGLCKRLGIAPSTAVQ